MYLHVGSFMPMFCQQLRSIKIQRKKTIVLGAVLCRPKSDFHPYNRVAEMG